MKGLGPFKRSPEEIDVEFQKLLVAHKSYFDEWLKAWVAELDGDLVTGDSETDHLPEERRRAATK